MSCPPPKAPPTVETLTYAVHPAGPCLGEEELAATLYAEQLEHGATRERLAEARRELERLRPVVALARHLASLTDAPVHTPEQENALERELADGLLGLAFVLALLPEDVSEKVARG